MSYSKIAISIDSILLKKLDYLVKNHGYDSRSRAIQEAVAAKIASVDKVRLAKECAKLDKAVEQSLADEGLSKDLDLWPEY